MPEGSVPRTIVDFLQLRAAHNPNDVVYAYLTDGETNEIRLTFGELWTKARAIAAKLREVGASGERALLLYPPGLDYAPVLFGCFLAGVIAVPEGPPDIRKPERSLARLNAVATNAQAAFVLVPDNLLTIQAKMPAGLSEAKWIATDTICEVSPDIDIPLPDPESIAYLQYTSGSTADPKGVMVTHRNLFANCEGIQETYDLRPDSVMVSWVPAFHDLGLVYGVSMPVYAGFRCVTLSSLHFIARPIRWLEAISRYRATHSIAPNSAYDLAVLKTNEAERKTLDLSTWTVALNGAEPVQFSTEERFVQTYTAFGFRSEAFSHSWGLSEATAKLTGERPGDRMRFVDVDAIALGQNRVVAASNSTVSVRKLASCGQPASHTELAIVDAETQNALPADIVGEVWVRGASVGLGYWQAKEETEAVFGACLADGRGPYLRTGDYGFLRDGRLFITGRLKDIIIVRGQNHYPQDIEESLTGKHAALRMGGAVAFSINGEDGERVVIVAEVYPDRMADPESIYAAIRSAVSDHGLRPSTIVLAAPGTIPKTTSGKLQRRKTRQLWLDGQIESLSQWTATFAVRDQQSSETLKDDGQKRLGDTIATIAEIVASLVRISIHDVPADRPLKELGLDSVMFAELAQRLTARVGIAVPVTVLFDEPSPIEIAEWIVNNGARRDECIVHETHGDELIAIVGMACRFPGGIASPDALWKLLNEERDAISDFPDDRGWPTNLYDPDPDALGKTYTHRGGFIDKPSDFDATFFGIASREAVTMDPQQRLLLEVSWEALENAGIDPQSLRGGQTGVYTGLWANDYEQLGPPATEATDGYGLLGSAVSMASGRIAYALGLHGPALTVDTACSASLVALHLARVALQRGECNLALAGGATVFATPNPFLYFSRLRALSPDGLCKAFAASADGAGWSEGVGMLVLERLADAQRHGHPVLAIVRGSAINQDGRSQGLTAPNGNAQQRVIRAALADAGVEPSTVDVVEAHGTGTKLGDPIEAAALIAAYGQGRARGRPLHLGTVKSNLGHTQAAAGIAGVMKMVLALQHDRMPKTLHLDAPSPHVDWSTGAVELLKESLAWPRGTMPRRAGVSAFGISGTNAHVILEDVLPSDEKPFQEASSYLLPLSAKTPEALATLAKSYQQWLLSTDEPLHSIAYTASVRRTHWEHRLCVVGENKGEMAAILGAFAQGECPAGVVVGKTIPSAPKVVFVFPGQGSQWVGMGRQLYRDEPVFRGALSACDQAIRKEAGFSIIEELDKPEETSRLDDIDVVQPVLFAIEVALAELWRSWGMKPTVVVGHSMGEVAAAFVAGALSMQDASAIICRRSRLLRRVAGQGAMALVELTRTNAELALRGYEQRLSVAVSNGPRSTVLAGEPDALEEVLGKIEKEGVFIRRIKVDVASHSPQMDPLRDELLVALASVSPINASIPMHSTVTGERIQGTELSSVYWANNLRRPVLFSQAIEQCVADGQTIFLEMSPHPVLTHSIEDCLREAGAEGVALASMRRAQDERQTMLWSLGALHVFGSLVHWKAFFPDDGRVVRLPAYPWQRKHHWVHAERATPQPMQGPTKHDIESVSKEPESLSLDLNTIHQSLRDMIRDVTGLSANDIDAQTALLQFGLDSLALMQIRNALRRRFGITLPTTFFFESTTSLNVLAERVLQLAPAREQLSELSGPTSSAMVTTNVSPIQTTARPFVPYRPIKDKASLAAPKRPDYLDELIREICARTPKSKAKTQTDRFVFASNRNITGLTPALKEITYQIIAERTAGSRIWDIDGNEYIDLTMGFGSSLLGHRHPAVTAALHAQIDASYAVGPIANQAGDVARLVSELTGMQRVAFFNSGTEAVMVAIRLARAVTGKPKIVIFEGSYHGMFDGVLGVAKPRGTYGEAISMAPGVPDSMIDDVLMLRYDDPYALEVIEARAAEIGAVLVEPVQSRQPNLQPRAFLHRLREITRQKEIALVFDEMITGFRAGPDGAQTWFAVDADIATYGKVIGGGMPIGIVAGSAEFLDALDGGMWHYGDDSFPTKTNTFVAGTFCAHPLTMASARVLLEILVSEGPALQRTLNTRTRRMCARLNDIFANERLPIHVVNFASLFRIVLPPEFYLFFHRLVSRGIYVGELRNLFLTTAHSDDDINQVVEVVRDTAKWLARFVLPEGDFSHSGFGITQIHATSPQRVMFARCQRKHAGKAYHVSSAFRVFGALQMDRIEPAITELVRRHQSLRTCFLQNGDILWQRFHPVGSFELAHETIDEASIASFVDRVIAPSFDLTMPGLFRCAVGELTPNEWLLVFDIHHLIVDGISMERIVEEFFILYSGGALSEPIAHYAELVDWERLYLDSEKAQQDESFWRSMLLTKVPRLEFPADFPPEDQRQFEGSFVRFQLSDPGAFRAFAREHETTVQVLLNAIFRVFSWVITGQTAVRFGSPTAGRPTEQFEELVGLFIGVVVYQAIITGDKTFATILQETRTQVLQAFDAQHYPFERIAELAGCTDGQTPFEVGFSYEASRTRGAQRLGDLEIVPYPVPRRNFSMEIVLICLDDAESFNMRIAFNPRRFRHQTVEAWTVRFNELAHALIAAPNQPLLKFQ